MAKTHKLYDLHKPDKEQLEQQEREDIKYLIYAIVMVFLGAVIVTCIFKLMEAGLGL